jgi:predicted GH43/DUF377 family glycosyl hydrolase
LLLPKNQAEPVKHLGQFWISTPPLSGSVFGQRQQHNCQSFAQAPQALVLADRVRIYFSTRELEASSGKFLSHVVFVDINKSFSKILQVSQHTVLALGRLGTFDEHGIFPMNVLQVGKVVYGYTSGVNRRVSVPADGAIGLAVSHDQGYTFQRMSDGPVIAASLREPCIVVDPFVKIVGSVFHMWYVFGLGWKQFAEDDSPGRVYKIGHATSKDGIEWQKEEGRQILTDRLGETECQALPTVMEFEGEYHMFFCYRQASDFRKNPQRSYRIGHAFSSDLVSWERDDSQYTLDMSVDGWDAEMLCYPHVFQCDGNFYMLYNGNAFGKFGFGLAVLK